MFYIIVIVINVDQYLLLAVGGGGRVTSEVGVRKLLHRLRRGGGVSRFLPAHAHFDGVGRRLLIAHRLYIWARHLETVWSKERDVMLLMVTSGFLYTFMSTQRQHITTPTPLFSIRARRLEVHQQGRKTANQKVSLRLKGSSTHNISSTFLSPQIMIHVIFNLIPQSKCSCCLCVILNTAALLENELFFTLWYWCFYFGKGTEYLFHHCCSTTFI